MQRSCISVSTTERLSLHHAIDNLRLLTAPTHMTAVPAGRLVDNVRPFVVFVPCNDQSNASPDDARDG